MAPGSAVSDRQAAEPHTAALARRARAGEAAALEQLHTNYDAPIARYLRVLYEGDGDRLAARTWLYAAQRLHELPETDAGIRLWLLGLARNQLARAEGPERLWDDDAATSRLLRRVEIPADGPSYFSPTTMAGDASAGKVLDALPRDEAEVVLLAVLIACTFQEISATIGRSVTQVREMQRRAGNTLERAFGASGASRLLTRAAETTPTPPPQGLVPAMVDAATHRPIPGWGGRTSKAATKVAIVGLVLAGTTGAAAASGSLPSVAQDRIASVVSHLGVDLPDSGDDPSGQEGTDPGHGDDDSGQDGSSENEAPGDTGGREDTHGSDVSDVARNTDAEGPDKGKAVSDTARGDNGPESTGKPESTGRPEPANKPEPASKPAQTESTADATAEDGTSGTDTTASEPVTQTTEPGTAPAEDDSTDTEPPGHGAEPKGKGKGADNGKPAQASQRPAG